MLGKIKFAASETFTKYAVKAKLKKKQNNREVEHKVGKRKPQQKGASTKGKFKKLQVKENAKIDKEERERDAKCN